MGRAFLTGSRRYGEPQLDSDWDIVILVDRKVLEVLTELSENYIPHEYDSSHSRSLRFGQLNIIATTDEGAFAAWYVGTAQLSYRKSFSLEVITRTEAVRVIKDLLESFSAEEPSGGTDDGSYPDDDSDWDNAWTDSFRL